MPAISDASFTRKASPADVRESVSPLTMLRTVTAWPGRVTVMSPATSMSTSSLLSGTRSRSQFSGSCQLAPSPSPSAAPSQTMVGRSRGTPSKATSVSTKGAISAGTTGTVCGARILIAVTFSGRSPSSSTMSTWVPVPAASAVVQSNVWSSSR